ncbi:MAG: CAP domain-containing protein [Hyphomicrobiaceae bacterium]
MPFNPDLARTEAAIIEMTNAFRREHALGRLTRDPKLASAAGSYAKFLAASTIFTHEADGRRPSDRIGAAGYAACSTAENLAWMSHPNGFETMDLARRLMEGWKKSPPHRRNLMLDHAVDIGVAVIKVKGRQKYMAVQLFARPQRLKYQFTIENLSGHAVPYTFAGRRERSRPNTVSRYTACEPGSVEFELSQGGLLSKAQTASFAARDGTIFRLRRDTGRKARIEVVEAKRN